MTRRTFNAFLRACAEDCINGVGDIFAWTCACGWHCRKGATECPSCLAPKPADARLAPLARDGGVR